MDVPEASSVAMISVPNDITSEVAKSQQYLPQEIHANVIICRNMRVCVMFVAYRTSSADRIGDALSSELIAKF